MRRNRCCRQVRSPRRNVPAFLCEAERNWPSSWGLREGAAMADGVPPPDRWARRSLRSARAATPALLVVRRGRQRVVGVVARDRQQPEDAALLQLELWRRRDDLPHAPDAEPRAGRTRVRPVAQVRDVAARRRAAAAPRVRLTEVERQRLAAPDGVAVALGNKRKRDDDARPRASARAAAGARGRMSRRASRRVVSTSARISNGARRNWCGDRNE